MLIKKGLCLCTALTMAVCLAACGSDIKKDDIPSSVNTDESSQTQTTTVTTVTTPEPPPPRLEQAEITGSELEYTPFTQTIQAESAKLSGDAKKADRREGFSGEGYVTGISAQGQWQLEFDLPRDQYYNVSLAAACDSKNKNAVTADGKRLSSFTFTGNGHFEIITVKNIYLEKGRHTVSIEIPDPSADIDYCTVTASEDISKISFALDKPALSNKNADENAQALYSYMCSVYGKNILLAQHDTIGTLAESQLICKTTGKRPAIRFGDLMNAADRDSSPCDNDLECAEKFSSMGGIVAYMWHWKDPLSKKSSYASETDFDLSKAVTKEDISLLPISDIEKLKSQGKISGECLEIVKDIDAVSQKLLKLQSKGIPVIWRPLHEASNGYFWWGKDAASYKWLWELVYKRQTGFHKLNNLIWVWSAQNASWYVGDSMCDIISCDIYKNDSPGSGINNLLFLQSISRKKPAAMTECDVMPTIRSMVNEKAYWSFVGQWGGSYLMKQDGSFSQEFTSEKDLKLIYNNNVTLTMDKLPSLSQMKQDLARAKEKEKADLEAKEKAEKESKKTE